MKLEDAIKKLKYRKLYLESALGESIKILSYEEIEYGWLIYFTLQNPDPLFGSTIYMNTCFIVDKHKKVYYEPTIKYTEEEYIERIKKKRQNTFFVIRMQLFNFIRDSFERLLYRFPVLDKLWYRLLSRFE